MSGGCGRDWCSDSCAEADGYVRENCKIGKEIRYCKPIGFCEFADKDKKWDVCEECSNYIPASCSYCRGEEYEDDELLEYALKMLNMSRLDLIKTINNKE